MSSSLPSGKSKELRNKHALYKRMSGEVVWLLLEENGYDADFCDTFMNQVFADMHHTLNVMNELEDNPAKYLAFEVAEKACKKCACLAGKVVPATDPLWVSCLPPFGVGCKVTCKAVSYEEATHSCCTIVDAKTLQAPATSLLCSLYERD